MNQIHQRIYKYIDPLYYLRFVEYFRLRQQTNSEKPQLFILGLPRSGTTLVYQYIVHRLQVAYFTNSVGKYPHSAVLATWLDIRRHGEYRSDFNSKYGKVNGPVSPREAGEFWARFFDLERYIRFDEVSPSRVKELQRSIAGIQQIFGDAPFVNKNVKHMLRLDALLHIFPASVFLIVERSLEDTALSILRARYANNSDPSTWWSVRPPDYDTLKNVSIPQQIARQINSLTERMEADLNQVPVRRLVRVKYDAFCRKPECLINTLRPLLGNPGNRNLPEDSFPIARNTPETPEDRELLNLLSH